MEHTTGERESQRNNPGFAHQNPPSSRPKGDCRLQHRLFESLHKPFVRVLWTPIPDNGTSALSIYSHRRNRSAPGFTRHQIQYIPLDLFPLAPPPTEPVLI